MMEKIRDGNGTDPGVATDEKGFLMESKSNQEIVPATPGDSQDGQSLDRVTPGGGLSMAALAMGLQRASKNQLVEGEGARGRGRV